MDKKGAEKLISVWWIFALAVIAVGVVIGVTIYYSGEFNVNKIEADILKEKIIGCLVDNGYLNQDFLLDNFDIFKKCGLKREMFEKGSNFYFNVSISDGEKVWEINGGDYSFEKNCKIGKKVNAATFPKCSEETLNILNEEKIMRLIILTGSNQAGGELV